MMDAAIMTARFDKLESLVQLLDAKLDEKIDLVIKLLAGTPMGVGLQGIRCMQRSSTGLLDEATAALKAEREELRREESKKRGRLSDEEIEAQMRVLKQLVRRLPSSRGRAREGLRLVAGHSGSLPCLAGREGSLVDCTEVHQHHPEDDHRPDRGRGAAAGPRSERPRPIEILVPGDLRPGHPPTRKRWKSWH